MSSYEQRIDQFAQDKKLMRLSRPIRDRADAFCDACGSSRPRTLYALMDVDTQRHYFVGDSCMKELARRGVISRKFGKQSGKQAYEAEIKMRGLGPRDNAVTPQATVTRLPFPRPAYPRRHTTIPKAVRLPR